jgi:hypothetical protein
MGESRMKLFNTIEHNMLQAIQSRLKIETILIDTPDEVAMVTNTYFDGELVNSHKENLEPLIELIKRRL